MTMKNKKDIKNISKNSETEQNRKRRNKFESKF